jgi:hypothetical protein
MEGSRSHSPVQLERCVEQTCSQCGRTFRPHITGDGAEELCDLCYDAEFEAGQQGSKRKAAAKRAGSQHR